MNFKVTSGHSSLCMVEHPNVLGSWRQLIFYFNSQLMYFCTSNYARLLLVVQVAVTGYRLLHLCVL